MTRTPFSRVPGVLATALLAAAAIGALALVPPSRTAAFAAPAVASPGDDLAARMSLDDKVGQMTQAERAALKPVSDLATYRIGSVLSGGGSAPTPNTPAAWADMYDGFQRAAMASPLRIPLIYGVDAVHGHNNVRGATIFPHNIG